MITLTIRDLKSQKQQILCFNSKDKAENKLQTLITDPKEAKELKKGSYLVGWSFDTESEKKLIESYVVESRRVKGESEKHG